MATKRNVVDDAAPVGRSILEDRYDGLLEKVSADGSIDPTKLQERLDNVLDDLVVAVARAPRNDDDPVVDEAEALIRETVITRFDELGLARPGSHVKSPR